MALINCKECGQMVSTQAYTCPHCGAPQRAAPPPIPPTIVVQPHTPEKKKKMGIFSGCLVIILAVFIIGLISAIVIPNISPSVSTSPDVGKSVGQNGAVDHQSGDSGTSSTVHLTAQVRFTETQITIHNGDTFDWTNVKLEINAGVFSSGFVLNVPRIGAGQDYVTEAMQFAKSNGERFNPFTYKLQSIDVWCDTPNGQGAYFGKSR